MRDIFVLDEDGAPLPCDDLTAWGTWCAENRVLAKDIVGETRVSTVFLGINHASDGPPVLWETMIFGGPLDEYAERYTSRTAALEGHARAAGLVQATSPQGDGDDGTAWDLSGGF